MTKHPHTHSVTYTQGDVEMIDYYSAGLSWAGTEAVSLSVENNQNDVRVKSARICESVPPTNDELEWQYMNGAHE